MGGREKKGGEKVTEMHCAHALTLHEGEVFTYHKCVHTKINTETVNTYLPSQWYFAKNLFYINRCHLNLSLI